MGSRWSPGDGPWGTGGVGEGRRETGRVPAAGTGRRNPKTDFQNQHSPRNIFGQNLNFRRPPRQGAAPQRGLAHRQGPHGGRGPGSPVRHAHVSPYLCDSPVSGQRERPGNRPGAARPRQHQDHHDLRQGHHRGQGPGCGRPSEGLPGLATESCIWCELASTTTRKSRSSARKCCESLTHSLPYPPSSLPLFGPDDGVRDLGPIRISMARLARARDPWGFDSFPRPQDP
jgi:hypothetical protein